jgi:hypothetical protein
VNLTGISVRALSYHVSKKAQYSGQWTCFLKVEFCLKHRRVGKIQNPSDVKHEIPASESYSMYLSGLGHVMPVGCFDHVNVLVLSPKQVSHFQRGAIVLLIIPSAFCCPC